jgi:hypothetical protein
MTLDEAIAQFVRPFPPTSPKGAQDKVAPTGEPYVIITSGGQKEEGEAFPAVCRDEETAVRLWLEAVHAYAKPLLAYHLRDGKPRLYWRTYPEMKRFHMTIADERQTHREAGVWYTVYSRLLISSTEPPAA